MEVMLATNGLKYTDGNFNFIYSYLQNDMKIEIIDGSHWHSSNSAIPLNCKNIHVITKESIVQDTTTYN